MIGECNVYKILIVDETLKLYNKFSKKGTSFLTRIQFEIVN